MGQIELIEQAHDTCGESPIWDPREKALYWCDTQRPLVHRYDRATGRCQSFGVDRTHCPRPRQGGGGSVGSRNPRSPGSLEDRKPDDDRARGARGGKAGHRLQ
ncbi:MAG: SMP-30/gluconolactonase/LRE family protein [Spirochaetes bacterium]|nr:SMP-30/gluconolactonase/LRE family protein [Spirochaetota bacterium]